MLNDPKDASEHCPGLESKEAGKASACEGCPNQKVCATGETRKPDPDIPLIKEALSKVKNKIIILSGKGGVGKSTLTTNLALALAQDECIDVGVFDIDLCGPSIPRMLGIMNEESHASSSGYSPIYRENIAVMSTGFLIKEDVALCLKGDKKDGLIKKLLKEVNWNTIDYLLIDTPPGTSNEHLTITSILGEIGVNGAVIVTTPQEISLLDVRKQINFLKKVNVPVICMVENMSKFICGKCGNSSEIFPRSIQQNVIQTCDEMQLKLLVSIPIDQKVTRCCDEGRSLFEEFPESSVAKSYKKVADYIVEFCKKNSSYQKNL